MEIPEATVEIGFVLPVCHRHDIQSDRGNVVVAQRRLSRTNARSVANEVANIPKSRFSIWQAWETMSSVKGKSRYHSPRKKVDIDNTEVAKPRPIKYRNTMPIRTSEQKVSRGRSRTSQNAVVVCYTLV